MTGPKQPDHDCPGGCGMKVKYQHLACRSCWSLLPQRLQQAVSRGGPNRLHAVSQALSWYRRYRETGQP